MCAVCRWFLDESRTGDLLVEICVICWEQHIFSFSSCSFYLCDFSLFQEVRQELEAFLSCQPYLVQSSLGLEFHMPWMVSRNLSASQCHISEICVGFEVLLLLLGLLPP